MTNPMRHTIAKTLLDLKAVVLSPQKPFTWASGLRSPIYCDNRLIISDVEARQQVIEAFLTHVDTLPEKPGLVAGCATAGIPHAAWLADRLRVPMVYVRSSQKAHGKQNRIEGRIPQGASALVIEDLISTGGSSIAAAECLRETGTRVIEVTSVFQYGLEKAKRQFAQANLSFQSLTGLNTLIEVAVAANYLSGDDLSLLRDWQKDPKAWSDQHGSPN